MTRYTYLAADLLTGEIRDEIPFGEVSFSHVLGGAGGFEGKLPLEVLDRFDRNRVTRSVLDPARTLLHVLRNGVPVWNGVLWAVQAEVEADTLSLAGQGLWSYFLRRLLEETKTYSAEDQFEIVADLIAYAQAQAGGDLGLVVAWDALSGVLRDRTYFGYERKNIGEAIKQLSEVDNGFDFAVDVTGTVSAGFTYTLNLSYPHRGRRTNLVFETKKNVRVLSWGLDAYTMTNRQTALGAGEGDGMLIATSADPASLSAYPLLQAASSHKDVSVFDTLADHARAELRAAVLGTETLSVEVLPSEVDAALGSFITGDEIKVRGGKGYLALDAFYRVTSYGVKVDSSGREVLQATLSRSEETI